MTFIDFTGYLLIVIIGGLFLLYYILKYIVLILNALKYALKYQDIEEQ